MKSMILGFALVMSFGASALTLEAAKGKTEFLAIGRPSALKVNGTGKGPTGSLTVKKDGENYILSGEAVVDLSTFDTQMETRNQHMKEKYLEVDKYRDAKLTFENVKVPASAVESGGTAAVTGTLDLHGKTNPQAIEFTFKPAGGDVAAEAKFKVKLSDHGIEQPKFTFITITDEIQVKTETLVSKAALKEGA